MQESLWQWKSFGIQKIKLCLRPRCRKLKSGPTGVTTLSAVPHMPDLSGLEKIQERVTKLSLGNGGDFPGAFLLLSHLHGSMIKPKTIPHPYTDIR